MKSLKYTKKQKKEHVKEMAVASPYEEEYPWGARLRFEDDDIGKLGLGKVNAGDKVGITAIGKIIEVHTHEGSNRKNHKSVEIQIQEIDIETSNKKIRNKIAEEVWDE